MMTSLAYFDRSLRALAVGSFLIAPGCTGPVTPASRDTRVDSIMGQVIRAEEPGASVIVIQNGRIVHEAGYGLANLETREANTPATLYHMASTGKQFTGLAVMLLKEQGLLDYDDPIGSHLPELARFGDRVTIRELLHHVSGLPDYYDQEDGYGQLLGMDSTPENDDALKLLATWGTPLPGGVEMVYSNAGYDLLGTLVERKSGQSLDGFMQQHVFRPLGMRGAFSMPNEARYADPNRARGYHREKDRWVVDDTDPLDNLVGSGSIYASAHDLFAYDQALYGDRLVKQTTLAEALSPTILRNGDTVEYGFGWRVGTREGRPYAGHGGSWEGYLSYILRFPQHRFSVFVLANRTDVKPEELAFKIFGLYSASLQPQ